MAATFHIRREGAGYKWVLATDDDRVIARGPRVFTTHGEADAAISEVRRELVEAEVTTDTVPAESRWKGIDMTTGETQDGPAPEPEETHDEGETGPPEVDGDAPRE